MSFLDNHVNNNLSNVTNIGRTFVQNLAKAVCAKTDLGNLNTTGKNTLANLASPAGSYITLSMPGSSGGTVTAPGNGYLAFWAQVHTGGIKGSGFSQELQANGGSICLENDTTKLKSASHTSCKFQSNGSVGSMTATAVDAEKQVNVFLPVRAGDVIKVLYYHVQSSPDFVLRFIPLEGN